MMNNELRPYKDMKLSHQDWLNEVPNHWKLVKAKRIFRETSIKNYPDEELLSATQNRGVIPRRLLDTRVVMPMGNFESFKLVKEGNFVISLRSFQGGLEYSKYQGIVSPAYNVLEEYTGQNRMYFKQLMKSQVFISELQRNVTGIRQGKNIDVNDFKEIVLPIPPRPEQDQVVRYLDHQLAKINKFIKAKKKLIAVLKEQKQAIINEAVTKGLDPNVKMKPSGIEWLGDVPEHWKIVQLKRLAKKIKTGGTPSGADEQFFADEGFNWYTPGDFTDAVILSNATRQLSALGLKEVNIFPPKTVMMIGIGGTMGKVSLANAESSCNQQINAISCGKEIQPEFLVQYLRAAKPHIFATAKYTTLPILNQEETKKILVPLVPIDEQEKIISFINQKTVVFDNSIKKLENELQLINEYKNSLISDVVTGKVDVRNIVIEESEEDIIEDAELDEESVDEEVLEAEDGDE